MSVHNKTAALRPTQISTKRISAKSGISPAVLVPHVSCYQSSPEAVTLQIRNEKFYSMAVLSADEARQIAAFLEEAANAISPVR